MDGIIGGIRELIGEGGIREIQIGGCPKLTDWSALEGADLERLYIYGDLVIVPEWLLKAMAAYEAQGGAF